MNMLLPDQRCEQLIKMSYAGDHNDNVLGQIEELEEALLSKPAGTRHQLDLARQSRHLGRVEQAAALIGAILQQEPHQVEALIERGQLLNQTGDHPGAAEAFRAASLVAPEHVGIRLELVRQLRFLNCLDEAESLIDDLIKGGSKSFGALVERGHIRRRRGDHAGAAAAFEAAAALDPEHIPLRLEWIRALRAIDGDAQAETMVDDLLTRDPASIGGLVERGHLYRKSGNFEAAARAFEAASNLAPHQHGLRLEWVRDLRLLNRFDQAEALVDDILAQDMRHLGALIERGHLRRAKADHASAAEAFETALVLEPSSVALALELARELKSLGQEDRVRQLLRRMLTWPEITSSSAARGLVHMLVEQRWRTEAEALLLALHQARPSDTEVLLALSQLARQSGNHSESLRYLRVAAGQDKIDIPLQLSLAVEFSAHGLYGEALQRLQTIVAADEANYPALRQLGFLLRAIGDLQQSERAFEAALALDPLRIEAMLELARARRAAGKLSAAQALLDEALAQDAGHYDALICAAEAALAQEALAAAENYADRARTLHPRQLGAHLLSARIAAESLEHDKAAEILRAASAQFGSRPQIAATQIFLLRQQRQHHAARLRAAAALGHEMPFGLWSECAALANTLGDFVLTEQILNHALTETSHERAQAEFFRAQIAEGRRDYEGAIGHYRTALQLNPMVGGWYGELARCHLLTADTAGAHAALVKSMTLDAGARRAKRQSLNLSQHHVGQLLDEFQLDRRVLSKLQDIVPFPADQQVAPLKQVVLANPDNTAPAMLLMIAARRAGLFSRDVQRDDAGIPKRIIQFWNSRETPPEIEALMQSWRILNPDHEHILFDDASARQFLEDRTSADIVRAFDRVKHPAQRADLFRLGYLAQEGGFYVDADDRCLGHIGLLFPNDVALAVYQENYGTVANNVLGAANGHPVILRALELAVKAVLRGDNDIVWLSTGPGLLTRAFAQILAESDTLLDQTIVRELGETQRFIGLHCPAQYKRTDQHWSRAAFSQRTK
jgi:mannosyltransferase OCH1-like enzyme/Tfp pilus assembly protein PilF